jgi:hypothetical protein
MGLAQFNSTIKQYIINKYEQQVTLGNLGTQKLRDIAPDLADSKKFRAAFEAGSSGHDSIITVKGLENLGAKLAESSKTGAMKPMARELFSKIDFNNFIAWLETRVAEASKRSVKSKTKVSKITGGVKLENISQSNAKQYFEEYVFDILDKTYTRQPATVKRLKKHISDNIEAGHLAGIFSLKFKLALGVDIQGLESAKSYRDFTVSVGTENPKFEEALDVIIKSLLDADYLTSSVVDKEDLFLVAVKYALGDNPRLQTELQFGKDNGGSGSLLGNAGKSIKALINNIASTSAQESSSKVYFKNLIESLESLQKAVEVNAKRLLETDPKYETLAREILKNNETLNALIRSKGSPSIIEGIGDNLINVIKTGKILKEVKTATSIKKTKSKKDQVSSNLNKIIKDTVKKVKETKAKIKSKKQQLLNIKYPKVTARTETSLASLMMLINSDLHDQIKRNMGTGNRRDVLNYRTGRFANSVKVERLSESRQGMITAFYSYMKNPYATFSQGGRQQNPRSRDPKLLISKSIRELAGAQVANRMRAVNV